jgi:hypothetical protein
VSVDESHLFRAVDRARALVAGHEFESLSEPYRVLLGIWDLEAEVNNGGFDQYFFNSSGDHAWFAPAALDAVGAHHTAALMRNANALFGSSGPPRDRNQRQGALGRMRVAAENPFERLDQAFYEYRDDLSTLVRRFLEKNAPELVERTKGDVTSTG